MSKIKMILKSIIGLVVVASLMLLPVVGFAEESTTSGAGQSGAPQASVNATKAALQTQVEAEIQKIVEAFNGVQGLTEKERKELEKQVRKELQKALMTAAKNGTNIEVPAAEVVRLMQQAREREQKQGQKQEQNKEKANLGKIVSAMAKAAKMGIPPAEVLAQLQVELKNGEVLQNALQHVEKNMEKKALKAQEKAQNQNQEKDQEKNQNKEHQSSGSGRGR